MRERPNLWNQMGRLSPQICATLNRNHLNASTPVEHVAEVLDALWIAVGPRPRHTVSARSPWPCDPWSSRRSTVRVQKPTPWRLDASSFEWVSWEICGQGWRLDWEVESEGGQAHPHTCTLTRLRTHTCVYIYIYVYLVTITLSWRGVLPTSVSHNLYESNWNPVFQWFLEAPLEIHMFSNMSNDNHLKTQAFLIFHGFVNLQLKT
jgi:hypothetical protein